MNRNAQLACSRNKTFERVWPRNVRADKLGTRF